MCEPVNHLVKDLFYRIFYEELSALYTIKYIDENTTKNSLPLFLDELIFNYIENLDYYIGLLSDKEIERAIKSDDANLKFVYANEMQMKMLNYNIRNIDGYKTISSCYDLPQEEFENSTKLIYLDNTILNYYNCIFDDMLDDENLNQIFKNLNHFQRVISYIVKVYKFEEYSINTGYKNEEKDKTNNETILTNPAPHIFVSSYAYNVFIKFNEIFKEDKNQLANYSFIYRIMQKENLIHEKTNQINFIEFLAKNNIHLDRIKTLNSIGNLAYKKEIYKNCK